MNVHAHQNVLLAVDNTFLTPMLQDCLAETSKLFRISVSFGSVSSTISMPVWMSHASVPAELRALRSMPDSLLRLSLGIEDVDDLIDDLQRSLDRA